MKINKKKRDGFSGEKLISLPEFLFERKPKDDFFLNSLYISHIGYFPKAAGHYRNRPKGCTDNILIYCTDGKGWFSIDTEKQEVSANQFFIIPATDKPLRYASDASDPWTIYWIHFTGSKLSSLNDSLSINNLISPKTIPFDEHRIKLWEMIYNCLEKGYSEENLSYANLSLYYLIANFLYPQKNIELTQKPSEDISDKVIEYMKNNISSRLTVPEIAAEFTYSASHFQTLFRTKTGISPIDYFIHLKVQRACQLLALSDLRIKEVAAAVGYADAFYFSRLFHKIMGSSPVDYKSKNRI
ncbi:AraC family transcriptional regulator [Pedobacter sp. FW305-3-2-15-E-R2A2]|jgi:AraC-like DNA-binding protein|uniref:AraC family transcriptional regulator n=1 Tax=Pedobacter sp. FW305-3-2-15-E-R2A2 TaxID=3140251 RepID=UPI00313FEE46